MVQRKKSAEETFTAYKGFNADFACTPEVMAAVLRHHALADSFMAQRRADAAAHRARVLRNAPTDHDLCDDCSGDGFRDWEGIDGTEYRLRCDVCDGAGHVAAEVEA